MIDLKYMRSQEYDTYLYMNQSLSSEVTMHHGLTTHFMNEASKLHEEDIFHGLDLHLEDVIQFQGQVDATIHRLMLFREHWSLYLLCVSRLERWIKKAQEIRVEMDMKVQLNANLAILNSASQHLEFAIISVPLSDASEHVQQLSQLQEYIHCLEGTCWRCALITAGCSGQNHLYRNDPQPQSHFIQNKRLAAALSARILTWFHTYSVTRATATGRVCVAHAYNGRWSLDACTLHGYFRPQWPLRPGQVIKCAPSLLILCLVTE
ncbi:unnamed protein product, partial [Timema podura]|nr:unnamed protein product [Timema podura]